MKLLTIVRDLRRRKGRERQGRFVAEGVRTVESLLQSPLDVTGVLYTSRLREEPRGAALLAHAEILGVPSSEIDEDELISAADTETPQGVLAVADIPEFQLPEPGIGFRLLVLDALQDPGNVGTILRTAAALGVHHTVALPGTVDLWNAKVVRSAMGASFTHPTSSTTWAQLESYLAEHHIPLWVSDADGETIRQEVTLPDRLALAMGNEGAGLSPTLRGLAERVVSIPMSTHVESLNVAVATGILLYALTPPSPVP